MNVTTSDGVSIFFACLHAQVNLRTGMLCPLNVNGH